MLAAGTFLSKSFGDKNYSSFSLMYDQKVTITESYIPAFSISIFFVSLVESLGLWLGVGAVQLINSGIGVLTYERAHIRP